MKTIQGRFRAAVLMGAAASVLAFAAGARAQDRNRTTRCSDSWHGNRVERQFGAARQSVAVRNDG